MASSDSNSTIPDLWERYGFYGRVPYDRDELDSIASDDTNGPPPLLFPHGPSAGDSGEESEDEPPPLLDRRLLRQESSSSEEEFSDEDSLEGAAMITTTKTSVDGKRYWVADTGASNHMGPTDDNMFDTKPGTGTIKVGNGSYSPVIKVGKRQCTVKQQGFPNQSFILEEYKQVPDL